MDHVIVLTASATRGLSDDDVASAARDLGSDTWKRLGRCGAEIAPVDSVDIAVMRGRYPGLDVNLVATEARRKRLLIADMDSTMIPVECIDEVADFAGVKPQVAEITERAMAGELDFAAALRERVLLIQGLPERALADVYAERIKLNPGARTLVRTMAESGAYCALVSGGFTFFTERVAAAAGFAEHRANKLMIADGRLSGRVADPILGREAKREAMAELAQTHAIGFERVIAVGDGANDLSMIEAAGLGVSYHGKPALAAKADAIVAHGDLTALLYLQGYAEPDFVND